MDYSVDDIATIITYRLDDEYVLDKYGGELLIRAWIRYDEPGVIDIDVRASDIDEDGPSLQFVLRVAEDD